MSYVLKALIGKQEVLEPHVVRRQGVRLVALNQGLALIPLTPDAFPDLEKPTDGQAADSAPDFLSPPASVTEWALTISKDGPVAYVAAEFWGGEGDQLSLLWKSGRAVSRPRHTGWHAEQTPTGRRMGGPPLREGAINAALRQLGATPGDSVDEFEAVGLGRARFTEEW